jgi:cyanophycinase
VRRLFERGGVIAGTSAMSETMLVKSTSQETHRIGDFHMAPGLGLTRDLIIDQHFAERGRFGRLIGAVAHNSRMLRIGVDENTAAVVEDGLLTVLGSGAVYIVDGSRVSYANLAEARLDVTLSLHNITVHVLAEGDGFDLAKRDPRSPQS